jgi:hypothetical protein
MSFNNQIDKLIEKNKHLKPVNMTHYDNPFLLLSETSALNELLANTLPSSRAEVEGIEPNDSHILGSGLTIYKSSSNNAENLARHAMNEVYKSPENRRQIEGYTMLNSFGDDRNVVYKSNKSNTILYGIRGTEPTSGTDWLTDLEIASSATLNVLPTGQMKERFNNANNIYSKLRELYPKSKIIMGGHSLGNSVGLDILYKHQSDDNMELYSYNGFLHPVYTGKKDPRNHPQRTENDIVSWWNSDKAKSFKTPMAKGVALTGAGIIGGIVAHKYRQNIRREGVEMAERQIPIPDDYMADWATEYDNAVAKDKPALLNDLDSYLFDDSDDFDDPDDYPSDDGEEKEDEAEAEAREEAEQRAEYEAEVGEDERIENMVEAITDIQGEEITTATAIRMALLGEFGATLGLGLLVAYGFYSHLSGNFKPERNRFISKKKP